MTSRILNRSLARRTLAVAAIAASISVRADAQCTSKYAAFPDMTSSGYWDVDLDDDVDEMAMLGDFGTVYVSALSTGNEKWSDPVALPPINPPTGFQPTAGRVALDGDYIIASLLFPSGTFGQYNAPGYVVVYARDAVGTWNGPFPVLLSGYTANPTGGFSSPGLRTDAYGLDVDILDQGATAHVFIGDPRVRPPASPIGWPIPFTDGAVFRAEVDSAGNVIGGTTVRIYRPGFGGSQPPGGGFTALSNFGWSIDLSPAGDRLAVGAPNTGRNNGQTTTTSGSAFTYNVIQNGAGQVVAVTADQTSPGGIVAQSSANPNQGNGATVATNGAWLGVSSWSTGVTRTEYYVAAGATAWTLSQTIAGAWEVAMGAVNTAATPGFAASMSPSALTPLTQYGTSPLPQRVKTANDSYIGGVSTNEAALWRTDCMGNTTCYDGIGSRYCDPNVPNSTGLAGVIDPIGNFVTSANAMTLRASNLPPNEFGYFMVSATQGFIPMAGGSQGNLCLSGTIGRYNQPVLQADFMGVFSQSIDLTALPLNPPTAVMVGDTYNFQAWHRDGSNSNFTNAATVTFQ